jgi:hypothetical protein
MLKAVLQKGVIVPLEPLPPDWEEGAALEVAKANGAYLDIDDWAKSMKQLCADSPPEEETMMRNALDEQRRQAKTQTRRDMGCQHESETGFLPPASPSLPSLIWLLLTASSQELRKTVALQISPL